MPMKKGVTRARHRPESQTEASLRPALGVRVLRFCVSRAPLATGFPFTSRLDSTFRIPHSQFTKCHHVTQREKSVLTKRTHLTPLLYRLKSRRRARTATLTPPLPLGWRGRGNCPRARPVPIGNRKSTIGNPARSLAVAVLMRGEALGVVVSGELIADPILGDAFGPKELGHAGGLVTQQGEQQVLRFDLARAEAVG